MKNNLNGHDTQRPEMCLTSCFRMTFDAGVAVFVGFHVSLYFKIILQHLAWKTDYLIQESVRLLTESLGNTDFYITILSAMSSADI